MKCLTFFSCAWNQIWCMHATKRLRLTGRCDCMVINDEDDVTEIQSFEMVHFVCESFQIKKMYHFYSPSLSFVYICNDWVHPIRETDGQTASIWIRPNIIQADNAHAHNWKLSSQDDSNWECLWREERTNNSLQINWHGVIDLLAGRERSLQVNWNPLLTHWA